MIALRANVGADQVRGILDMLLKLVDVSLMAAFRAFHKISLMVVFAGPPALAGPPAKTFNEGFEHWLHGMEATQKGRQLLSPEGVSALLQSA